MPASFITEWSERLLQAEADRRILPSLSAALPTLSAADAYAISDAVIQTKLDRGAKVIGYKLALTSQGTRAALGLSEPVAGVLLDRVQIEAAEGYTCGLISRQEMISPQVEPEQVFVLAQDLVGPGVTVARVLAATERILPGLEIPDSRWNWQVGAVEMMADNAASGRILLGSRSISPVAADLRLVGVVLEKNGRIMATGAGAAVLGHPAASVAWLANHLARSSRHLKAGQIIYTGSPVAALPVESGDVVRATFDHLGSVEVCFR